MKAIIESIRGYIYYYIFRLHNMNYIVSRCNFERLFQEEYKNIIVNLLI